MKVTALLLLACSTLLAQPPSAKPDVFAPLKLLVGEWRGTSSGQPGNGAVTRDFEFVLKDHFLRVRNTSVYPPQAKNKSGERHDDMGMIGYDSQRKKFVYRQFHSEGFVNTYVQQDSGTENKIVFVSEAIENIPPGYRAKETWTFPSPNEFIERFELAEPGNDFELYSETHLRRVK